MKDKSETEIRHWTYWEFWPAWIFYLPVAFYYAALAWKYRGFGIPALANPGIEAGGLVGESKMEVLHQLQKAFPEYTAQSWLLKNHDREQTKSFIQNLLKNREIHYPFILKPDTGQRGSGVKLIRNEDQADRYLSHCSNPIVLQQYVQGPLEAGVFYYRYPNETKGHIFAITDKHFPLLTGDGVSSLEQLILKDPRAIHMKSVYFRRFQKQLKEIPSKGKPFHLVQSGNHAQGCLFKDGLHLYSEALRDQIDTISRAIPGFFVGRYDIRYSSRETLMAGRDFKIVELNGAASEATQIYDPTNSLWNAYQTLFRQWEMIFRIGHDCRTRYPSNPVSGLSLLKRWWDYRLTSQSHPMAD